MDDLFAQAPYLKHQLKNASDIVRSGKRLGVGPNGDVEEISLRGNLCVGKKLHDSILNPTSKDSKKIMTQLATNCSQISHISHPNIATFFGLCIVENTFDSTKSLVLIREFAKDDLTNLLRAKLLLPLSVKASILLDVTKALDYLHMNKPAIIHGNLTSTNVLIMESMQAKIADMECSCFHQSRSIPTKSSFLPPEAIRQNPKFETASDMFSFGQIALHTAVHMLPAQLSEGSTEIEKRSSYIAILKQSQNVDRILYDLILSCLQDSLKKRPTASTAVRDLQQLEKKLACKGDKFHLYKKRMTMYEMIGKFAEDAECDSISSQVIPTRQLTAEEEEQRLCVSLIKGGQPGILFINEVVSSMGVRRGFNKKPKWMEYKFEISPDGFLQYSKLNGQVLRRASLDDVIYVNAHRKLGELDVYPFYVRFRSNECWTLGAHSERECKSWMEAILPGCTHNQWFENPAQLVGTHQSIDHDSRSSASQAPVLSTSSKIKDDVVISSRQEPPPIPDRPVHTLAEQPGNMYLTILPSSPQVDERTNAIAPYTLAQIHLMIKMFEDNVQMQPCSRVFNQQKRKMSCSEPGTKTTQSVVRRNSSADVSECSSKHPSKGLYMSFAAITEEMAITEETEAVHRCSEIQKETKPSQNSNMSPSSSSPQIRPSFGSKRGLTRQNAVRVSQKLQKCEDSSTIILETRTKLYKILRQQSSEELLDDNAYDKPEWSKAQLLKDIAPDETSSQSAQINSLSIASNDLHDMINIGYGHYGAVYRAQLIKSGKTTSVTVKVVQRLSEKEWLDFLKSVSSLVLSSNPNVVRIFGVVPESNWLVMEYTPLGDLKKYLACNPNRVSPAHLIKYMSDIAMGMHHIKVQGLVHRNLALRNVLIMEDDSCKVADLGTSDRSFSLSVGLEVAPQNDQRRWMAPENLYRGLFSEASDVWSFGVVQWEMFQPMRVPYSTLSSTQFPHHINSGHTLDIPDVCPPIVAKIMRACWNWNATKRPSFMYIALLLIQRTLVDVD